HGSSPLLHITLSKERHQTATRPKEFTDSLGRRKVKGNMDIELAVDAMELAPYLDHAVIFSGDGDFRPLIEALQRKGVRVSVVSTIRSQQPMIADELRRQADNFIELDELRDVIGRPTREARTDMVEADS
ncbi:MAG: NYN domain-containing protein, partial [Proteobacteria bacterium]|nr:NYN domain-containing protein [Pseudomonadota bacterium]